MNALRSASVHAEQFNVHVIDELLLDAGLGRALWGDAKRLDGRNATVAMTTGNGHRVIIKRILGETRDAAMRLRRSIAAATQLRSDSTAPLTPRLIAHDVGARTLIFDHAGEESVGARLGSSSFTSDFAAALGSSLNSLHNTGLSQRPTTEALPFDTSLPDLPSTRLWRAVPLSAFEDMTGAERRAWGLIHSTKPLVDAIARIEEAWTSSPTLIHGDLRLDQVIQVHGHVQLVDWEESRVGDPSRDVGFVIGDVLRACVVDAVRDVREAQMRLANGAIRTADLETALAVSIRSRVNDALPALREFLRAYKSPCNEVVAKRIGPEGLQHYFRFAGWLLVEAMLVEASREVHLGARARSLGGLGFDLLAEPKRFAEELNLDGPPEPKPMGDS